jgi:hypothetical protein
VNLFAGFHHLQLVRRLDRGETSSSHSTTQAVAVAFFLALIGVVMAVYLILIRG